LFTELSHGPPLVDRKKGGRANFRSEFVPGLNNTAWDGYLARPARRGTKMRADDRALADRGWWGYDPRAMVPAVAAAAAASVALLSGRWYLEGLSWLADRAGALAVFGLAVAVWPGLIAVLLYRAVTYTYRLTDRAVLIDRGFLARPEPPVWLTDLTAAEAGAGWLGRQLGVGWVKLTAGGRAVRLTGVRRPSELAAKIRETARESEVRDSERQRSEVRSQ
jgi:membrane protein YdbS with pleckstrin-like domain